MKLSGRAEKNPARNPCENWRSSVRDSKQSFPKYRPGVPTTRPRILV